MQSKKFIIFACILFIASFPVTGQPVIEDSSKAYHYWAKRGIIEVTYAFMNDFIETLNDSIKTKHEIIGKEKFKVQFIEKIEEKSFDRISDDFDDVSDFLNMNSWPGVEKNLFKPLTKKYQTSSNIDKSFFIIAKSGIDEKSIDIPGYTNKLNNWNRTQQQIIDSYADLLKKLPFKSNSYDIEKKKTLINPNKSPNEHETMTVPGKNNFITIGKKILTGMLLMFFGGLMVSWLIKNSINRILYSERKTYMERLRSENISYFFKFIGLVYILKQQKDKYKNEDGENPGIFDSKDERGLNQQIETLNKKVKELEIENSTLKEIKDNDKKLMVNERNDETKMVQNNDRNAILYFSIPESEGQFKIINGKQTSDENKFYKIEIAENNSSGKLHFMPGDLDIRAINDIDSYLIPVCEIENISNRKTANKIVFIKPGKVNLINDCWVIDPENKVKVKLV
jgi:hypothetical protein